MGLACLALGIPITIVQLKKFLKGKRDQFGFDVKLLGGAIGFIILGIALIFNSFNIYYNI